MTVCSVSGLALALFILQFGGTIAQQASASCRRCVSIPTTCAEDDNQCLTSTNERTIETAFFRGQSFLSYQVDHQQVHRIQLFFRTSKRNGLLVFAEGRVDAIAVMLKHSCLIVRQTSVNISSGMQTAQLLARSKGFNDNAWHKVVLTFADQISLEVDGRREVAIDFPTRMRVPVVDQRIWLGGVEHFVHHRYIDRLHGHYFRGCLAEVQLNNEKLLHAPAPGQWSPRVVNKQAVIRGCFSSFLQDTSHMPAVNFKVAGSYAAFKPWNAYPGSSLSLHLRTSSQRGVILYNAAEYGRMVFVAAVVEDGHLLIVLDDGGRRAQLKSEVLISDGHWHKLHFEITTRSLNVSLDHVNRIILPFSTDRHSNLALAGPLFLGGLNAAVESFLGANNSRTLVSCVRELRVNNLDENLLSPREKQSVNTGCRWSTACTRSPCRPPAECVPVIDEHYCRCQSQVTNCSTEQYIRDDTTATQAATTAPPKPRFHVVTEAAYVLEGREVNITEKLINISIKPAIGHPGPILITLTSLPDHGLVMTTSHSLRLVTEFTVADMKAERITYFHDDTEHASASASFCVEGTGEWPEEVVQPEKSCGYVLPIRVLPINDQLPEVVHLRSVIVPKGVTHWPISKDYLLVHDADNEPDTIVFEVIQHPSRGHLLMRNTSNKQLSRTVQFSQQDINDGRIVYKHVPGNGSTDSFSFVYTDGVHRGNSRMVKISVEPLRINVTVSKKAPFVLAKNGQTSVTLTSSYIHAKANDPRKTSNIMFIVTSRPLHGMLVNTSTGDVVDRFTNHQLQTGHVMYKLLSLDTIEREDHFTLKASLEDLVSHLVVAMAIEPKPTLLIHEITPVVASQGQAVTLDNRHVNITSSGSLQDVLLVIVISPRFGKIVSNSSALHHTIHQIPFVELQRRSVRYSPNGNHIGNDSFVFYATNGFRNTTLRRLDISVIRVHIHLLNHGLQVDEGGRSHLNINHLSATGPNGKEIVFTVVKAPMHGRLQRHATHHSLLTNFTQTDLVFGNIVYVHDNSETTNDSFSFTAGIKPDGGSTIPVTMASLSGEFRIKVVPVNDLKPRPVNERHYLKVVMYSVTTIQPEQLNFTDDDSEFDAAELLYTVQDGPHQGRLLHDTTSTVQFKQGDVNRGVIQYQHIGSVVGNDSVLFQVHDEDYWVKGELVITIEKLIVQLRSDPLKLLEGHDKVLQSENWHVKTNANTSFDEAKLSLWVIRAPQHGRLLLRGKELPVDKQILMSQINDGLVRYDHDDSDTTTDVISLRVQYYKKTVIEKHDLQVVITPVDDTPPHLLRLSDVLVNESSAITLTSQSIYSNDTEAASDELIFTISKTLRHGQLLLSGSKANRFSQDDVNRGRVTYKHTSGADLNDSLSFFLSDGANTIPERTLHIRVRPSEVILRTSTLSLSEGGNVIVTRAVLSVNRSVHDNRRVLFVVEKAPQHGRLYDSRDYWANIKHFTLFDVSFRRVFYKHDDTENYSDGFTVVASIEGQMSAVGWVNVTIMPVNDQKPYMIMKKDFVVWLHKTTIVTERELHYRDDDTIPAKLVYNVTMTTENSHFAMKAAPQPVTTFTQEDILLGKVLIVGSKVGAGKISFMLSDGRYNIRSGINTLVRKLRLVVNSNIGFHLNAFDKRTLSIDKLNISTNDYEHDKERTVMLLVENHSHALRYGHLEDSGAPGQPIRLFSLNDLDRGGVLYVHTDTEFWAPHDRVVLTVTTEHAKILTGLHVNFHIKYPTSPGSSLYVNKGLHLLENGALQITENYLQAQNVRARTAHQHNVRQEELTISYLLLSPPQHGQLHKNSQNGTVISMFTQDDVQFRRVWYVHDKSDSLNDVLHLHVRIMNRSRHVLKSVSEVLTVRIMPVNDQPVEMADNEVEIEVPRALSKELRSSLLKASDKDTPPHEIIYHVINTFGSDVQLINSSQSLSVSHFTQQDITDGSVSIKVGENLENSSIQLNVTDGQSSQLVVVHVQVVPQPIEFRVLQPLSILQGEKDTLLSVDVVSIKTILPDDEVSFSMVTSPRSGQLVNTINSSPFEVVSNFTMTDLRGNHVRYVQEDFSQSVDQFEIAVSNRFRQLPSQQVLVVVKARIAIPDQVAFPADQPMKLTSKILNVSELTKIASSSPLFTIIDPPLNGILVTTATRTSRSAVKDVSFSAKDLEEETVEYRPKKDEPFVHGFNDSFRFKLTAHGVQPAIETLHFSVNARDPFKLPDLPKPPEESNPSPKFPRVNEDDDFLMRVIVPAAAGGAFFFLLIIAVCVMVYRGRKQRKKMENNVNVDRATPIAVDADHHAVESNRPSRHPGETESDSSQARSRLSGDIPSHRTTHTRSHSDEVISHSDNHVHDNVHRATTLPTNASLLHTHQNHTSSTGGYVVPSENSGNINSHESLDPYDRTFDRILDMHDRAPSSSSHTSYSGGGGTALRKNEYWI